jgi:hypothetical protein
VRCCATCSAGIPGCGFWQHPAASFFSLSAANFKLAFRRRFGLISLPDFPDDREQRREAKVFSDQRVLVSLFPDGLF